ncbi:MAG: DUF4337 domain-containing protein [Myxococcota bacterium]|jgi:hypothetical protein
MAEEKKEPWMSWLALTTIILAVCATLSTFKGGGYSTRSILAQNKASNQWSYFQSKSIKGYLYENQKEQLEMELLQKRDSLEPGVRAEFEKRIVEHSARLKRYAEEKETIMKEAKALEAERDGAQLHSAAFGKAVIFLQISILLSSVAALLKRKRVYYLGLAAGVVGLAAFANGFWLFM